MICRKYSCVSNKLARIASSKKLQYESEKKIIKNELFINSLRETNMMWNENSYAHHNFKTPQFTNYNFIT